MATSNNLSRLRALIKNSAVIGEQINAYIIPTDDAHQSEIPAVCDRRREFITGFTGSAGTAIVTAEAAALWTDGRYYLQAEKQLDANYWTLMKDGLPTTLKQHEWLCKMLPPGGKVGTDAWLLSADKWKVMDKALASDGFHLVSVCENLADKIWENRPAKPDDEIVVHPITYSGETWQSKVKRLREKMIEKKTECVVVTLLDDIAWLFNLRSSDIPCVPVFFSYALVCTDSVHLFVDSSKFSPEVFSHLGLSIENGSTGTPCDDLHVTLHGYGDVSDVLQNIAQQSTQKVWISSQSSQALHDCIPSSKRLVDFCPITEMKAVKNDVEVEGMKNAHIKDAAALCEYFAWLETEVPKGGVTEISAATKLEKEFRAQHEDFMGISFDTISSVGANGAVIHYKPEPETDTLLTTEHIYLCDSGAQFRDGTTDVTRTMHFGNPTNYERECFTRVLKGHIQLDSVVFPPNIKGLMLDTLARTALWQVGLDYRHGTGHGVGAYLHVHEGPCGISYRSRPGEANLEPNMILSNEPGYYEDGKFGIRIENLIVVVPKETKYTETGYLTFEPITLVPIQTKMIDPSILTAAEIDWVNHYHQQCLDKVRPLLEKLGKTQAVEWLVKETQTIG